MLQLVEPIAAAKHTWGVSIPKPVIRAKLIQENFEISHYKCKFEPSTMGFEQFQASLWIWRPKGEAMESDDTTRHITNGIKRPLRVRRPAAIYKMALIISQSIKAIHRILDMVIACSESQVHSTQAKHGLI